MKTILAIDPGEKGGIAWKQDGQIQFQPMPETLHDFVSLIRSVYASSKEIEVYIEEVACYIPMAGQSQMFVFGRQFERPQAVCAALGIRMILVPPKVWQKPLCVGKAERRRTAEGAPEEERKQIARENSKATREWKKKLKERAQQLYPQFELTDKTADALLILDYALNTKDSQ